MFLLPFLFLTACDGFESGDVSKYVGTYELETANEKTYHISWNQKTLTNERNLNIDIKTLIINEDKTVSYTSKDGETKTGHIKVYEDYCRFVDTPIDSSYKFNIRYDGSIYYSYESSHFGVEYDVTYVNITFSKTSSYTGEDQGGIEIFRVPDERYKNTDYVLGLTSFDAIVKSRDGSINENIKGQHCMWNVGDTAIASVDSSGSVTAKKGGETTLTASSGNYSSTINIKVAVFATQFEYDSTIRTYEIGKSYDMPLTLNKASVTVFYKLSDDDIISITDNKFIANKSGKVEVHASAFVSTWGDMKDIDFTIEVKDKFAPYFKYANRVSTSGSGTVSKNKYSDIPYAALGVKAYSYNDEDITSQITVQKGEYDLSNEGVYDLILSVTDNDCMTSSIFALKLTVTEYEIKKTLSPIDALVLDSATYELVGEPYSLAVKSIVFKLKVSLNEKYDYSDAKVTAAFYFSIQNWGKYRTYDYTGEALKSSKTFTVDGERSLEFEVTFSPGVSLDPDTFTYGGANPLFSGYVYNVISY